MIKRLFGDAAIYTVSNVLSRAVGFMLLPLYARLLQPNELGQLDLITASGAILNLLIPLEISLAFARFSADTPPDSIERKTVAATTWFSLFITGTTGLAFISVLPLEQWLMSTHAKSLPHIKLLALMFWGVMILQYMVQNHLRWEGKARAYGLLGLVASITTVTSGYLLVMHFHMGVAGALLAMIGGMLVSSLVGVTSLRSAFTVRPSYDLWRKMIAFALPLWAGNIVLVLAQNADRFLIRSVMGLDALGEYGIAARLASVVAIAFTGMQMAIVPLIFAEHAAENTRKMLQQSILLFSLASAAVVAVLGCLAPEIVAIVASERYLHVAPLLPIMALSTVLFGAHVFFPGLWIDKRPNEIAKLNIAYGILIVVSTWLGAWLWNLPGVAAGNLCSSIVYLCLVYRLSQRRYYVSLNYKPIFISIGVAVLSLVLAFLSSSILSRAIILSLFMFGVVITGWHYLYNRKGLDEA